MRGWVVTELEFGRLGGGTSRILESDELWHRDVWVTAASKDCSAYKICKHKIPIKQLTYSLSLNLEKCISGDVWHVEPLSKTECFLRLSSPICLLVPGPISKADHC